MTDDETMWRCIGALLLEGETFTEDRGCAVVRDMGGRASDVGYAGYVEEVLEDGVISMERIYRVSEKGRQFFLADHSKKED